MLGLTSSACSSYCIPRHELETWQQALLSVQCMLHPYSRAKRIINLPAKPHLLSSTKPIYFLLLLLTSYFKPVSKSQILLQSHQRWLPLYRAFAPLSLWLHWLLFHLFVPFTLVPMRKPAWTVERTDHWNHQKYKMLRKAAFSNPLSISWCTLVWMCCQDPSGKSEGRHDPQPLGHSLVWSSS